MPQKGKSAKAKPASKAKSAKAKPAPKGAAGKGFAYETELFSLMDATWQSNSRKSTGSAALPGEVTAMVDNPAPAGAGDGSDLEWHALFSIKGKAAGGSKAHSSTVSFEIKNIEPTKSGVEQKGSGGLDFGQFSMVFIMGEDGAGYFQHNINGTSFQKGAHQDWIRLACKTLEDVSLGDPSLLTRPVGVSVAGVLTGCFDLDQSIHSDLIANLRYVPEPAPGRAGKVEEPRVGTHRGGVYRLMIESPPRMPTRAAFLAEVDAEVVAMVASGTLDAAQEHRRKVALANPLVLMGVEEAAFRGVGEVGTITDKGKSYEGWCSKPLAAGDRLHDVAKSKELHLVLQGTAGPKQIDCPAAARAELLKGAQDWYANKGDDFIQIRGYGLMTLRPLAWYKSEGKKPPCPEAWYANKNFLFSELLASPDTKIVLRWRSKYSSKTLTSFRNWTVAIKIEFDESITSPHDLNNPVTREALCSYWDDELQDTLIMVNSSALDEDESLDAATGSCTIMSPKSPKKTKKRKKQKKYRKRKTKRKKSKRKKAKRKKSKRTKKK